MENYTSWGSIRQFDKEKTWLKSKEKIVIHKKHLVVLFNNIIY